MVLSDRRTVKLHRAGQAAAEWVCRELQQTFKERMSEWELVRDATESTGRDRELEKGP